MLAASLPAVDAVDRGALTDSRGRTFKDVARALAPRFARVWIDIGAGCLAIGLVMVAVARLERQWPRLLPLWIGIGATQSTATSARSTRGSVIEVDGPVRGDVGAHHETWRARCSRSAWCRRCYSAASEHLAAWRCWRAARR